MSRAAAARLRCMCSPGASAVVVDASYGTVADAGPGLRALLAAGADVVVRLHGPGSADVVVVDALARLALCARRGTGTLHVDTDDPDVRHLVELAGLAQVLRLGRP